MANTARRPRKRRGFYYPAQTPDEFWSNLAKLRQEAELAIDRLIEFVDQLDAPSEDREDEGDAELDDDGEPTLGSIEHLNQEKAWRHTGDFTGEPESDGDADGEPDEDREEDPAEMGIADMDGLLEQTRGVV
jgi:hypothetical protein